MASDEATDLLAASSAEVREVALAVRSLVRDVVPDAIEEVDGSAKLIGFTFIPGTYKGMFAAVAPHKAHVNLMFSKGVELLEVDEAGLLEGTGKRARHVRFGEVAQVDRPEVRALVSAAAERTPRA